MSPSLEADPDALRAVQPQFADLATRAQTAVAALQRVVDAEGPCWGTDKPGASFAQGYESPSKQTLDGLGSISGVLSSLGDTMGTVAAAIEQQDQQWAQTMKQPGSAS